MASSRVGKQIDRLIMAERWEEARAVIAKALQKEPDSHWLLTQLAETYYEQRQYRKALELLLQSRKIVPDCPLTLWHLAGTLDALGQGGEAIGLFIWLLRSQRTAVKDPCWESEEWTAALKTDCVYRLGLCFKHAGRVEQAAFCLRKYLYLLSLGAPGSYPVEEVQQHLHELPESNWEAVEEELRETADQVLAHSGEKAWPPTVPPGLDSGMLKQLQEA